MLDWSVGFIRLITVESAVIFSCTFCKVLGPNSVLTVLPSPRVTITSCQSSLTCSVTSRAVPMVACAKVVPAKCVPAELYCLISRLYKASGVSSVTSRVNTWGTGGCVKTLAQPFSIIYRPVIFSFVYAAFFSFIW